ncbi:MAG: RidA family protein [Parvibaculum sp.]
MQFYMVDGAPEPVAPFSHAAEVERLIFVTGQMPTYPGRPAAPLPDGIEAQTHLVIKNLEIVLAGLGLTLENVLRTGAYLTHFQEDYETFNQIYRSYFAPGRLPARTCIGVTGLARDARVEIDFVVYRP